MTRLLIAALAGFLLASGASRASAQSQWTGKGYVSANGGYQGTTNTFEDNVTFTLYAEQGDFNVKYKAEAAPVIDVSGGVRVWRNLGVGVGVTSYRRTSRPEIAARVPHPFFFNQLRDASGTVDAGRREELAVHVQALWMIPVASRVDVAVFGGPSFFQLKQPVVETLQFSDVFPYDTVTLSGANTSTPKLNKTGFNIGADVMYMFTKTIGVGGIVRFTQAKFTVQSSATDSIDVTAGGAQAGAGVRLRF